MTYQQLIAIENLSLAWRRLTTGLNLQYKEFNRPLYNAYESAAPSHLQRLHQRLKGGWQPTAPTRLYIPKPSGLQRPLSLLDIEDQIVLQAVANVFAEKIRARRQNLENETVFSNILTSKSDSAFFFEDWRDTYDRFTVRRYKLLNVGFTWIAQFDLAAFYDTIAHELIIRQIAPRSSSADVWRRTREWFRCWSAAPGFWPYDHGIPQGPIASDLLAEVILLYVDEALVKSGVTYVRYADDMTIFAQSRDTARQAALELERVCRSHGLIPQGGKYAIREITKWDPSGILPSLAPPDRPLAGRNRPMSARDAEEILADGLAGRPQRVVDKSKVRYALYHGPKSTKLRRTALRLLERHPEHIDAIAVHLDQYPRSVEIERTLTTVVSSSSPYPYVRGKCWSLLAGIASAQTLADLREHALIQIRKAGAEEERTGAFRFLLAAERAGIGRVSGRLRSQPTHTQVLLIPELPDATYQRDGVVSRLLKSNDYRAGLLLAEQFVARGITHRDFGVRASDLPPEVQNAFRHLGLIIGGSADKIDQIADLLAARFGTPPTAAWRGVLGKEYGYARSLLLQADAWYDSNPSHWLQFINSFNDIAVRKFIAFLESKGLPGSRSTIGRDGKLIDLGVILDAGSALAKNHGTLVTVFRDVNTRRNRLPASHPFDKKTGVRASYLKRPERDRITRRLRAAYASLAEVYELN